MPRLLTVLAGRRSNVLMESLNRHLERIGGCKAGSLQELAGNQLLWSRPEQFEELIERYMVPYRKIIPGGKRDKYLAFNIRDTARDLRKLHESWTEIGRRCFLSN